MSLVTDYLTPRGVTDRDVIDARGYEEVPSGLKIPLYSIASAAGDGQPYGWEIRLMPPKIHPNGKVQKFDRPKGQLQQLSVNPLFWEAPTGNKPLLIVEGTTRADALHERGVHSVVSLTSCWGWKNANGIDPQYDELPLKGREVWIFFDGDVTSNHQVNVAAHRLSAVLEMRGATVRYGVVPDGKGLDDWLAGGHEVTGIRTLLVDELPFVEREGVTEDKFREGTELPRTSDAALARDWISKCREVCHVDGEWWAHVGGRWVQTPGGTAARTRLLPYMESIGQAYYEKGEQGSKAERAFGRKIREELESSGKCASVLAQGLAVEDAARHDGHFDRNPWLLNLANGTLDLKTRSFRPHDPADLLRGISPTPYDPAARCPEWLKFLDSALPDKSVQAYLRRMLGATLIGATHSQRVLVFSGPTRAGKGTTIRALFHVLGQDYSGELRREVIMKSRATDHQTQVMWLKGKRLASVNETNEGEEFDAAKLKMLSGGDEITARGMHQDQTTFKPSHNLILSTNSLPNVDSADAALWGRLRVIPFRRSFLGREDEGMDARLSDEASGILNWLLDGLEDYLRDGEGVPPVDVAKAKQEWVESGDSVAGFAESLLASDPPKGGKIGRGDMRVRYEQWCDDNAMEPVPVRSGKMKAGLEAKGFTERQETRAEANGRPRGRYWHHPQWDGSTVEALEPNGTEVNDLGTERGAKADLHGTDGTERNSVLEPLAPRPTSVRSLAIKVALSRRNLANRSVPSVPAGHVRFHFGASDLPSGSNRFQDDPPL